MSDSTKTTMRRKLGAFVLALSLAGCPTLSMLAPFAASADDAPAVSAPVANAVAVVASAQELESVNAASPVTEVRFDVLEMPEEGTNLYSAIDAIRTEHDLEPLTYDFDLETAAFQRAAETILMPANQRPDGRSFATADATGKAEYEGIYVASEVAGSDPAAVASELESLVTREDISSIGIGLVADSGKNMHWVVLVSSQPGGGMDQDPGVYGTNVTRNYSTSVPSANLVFQNPEEPVSVTVGHPLTLQVAASTTGTLQIEAGTVAFSSTRVSVAPESLTWTSSETDVASVDWAGTVTAVANGTCVVTAEGPSAFIEYDIEATGGFDPANLVQLSDCTVAGIVDDQCIATGEPIEPEFTVIDPERTAIDPSEYSYEFTNNVEPGEATLTITAVEGSRVCTGTLVKTFQIQPAPTTAVAIPDIIGMTQDEAINTFGANGLPAPDFIPGDVSDDPDAIGRVYATDPEVGTEIDPAATSVQAFFFSAPEPYEGIVVPDVIGLGTEDANGALLEAGVTQSRFEVGDPAPSEEQIGTVYRTDPDPGTVVDEASEVVAVVYDTPSDPSANTIPDVTGMSAQDAAEALAAAGYLQSRTVVENSAPAEDMVGVVYRTEPATGSEADPASEIVLYIYDTYAGPDATLLVPDVTGKDVTEATGMFTAAGLAEPEFETGDPAPEEGLVGTAYASNPAMGASVTATDIVVIYLYDTMGGGGKDDPVTVPDIKVDSISDQSYTGSEVRPALVVRADDLVLVEGTDYTVAYKNNTAVGTATATVTGIGTYAGKTATVTFQIVNPPKTKTDISKTFQIAPIPDQTYTGSEIRPLITVSDGGTTLSAGTQYTVTYGNNVGIGWGTATVTVEGVGDYEGTLRASFTIRGDINQAEVSGLDNQFYTGSPITPTPVVRFNGSPLTMGTDYSVSYQNNVNAGTATAIIVGNGLYFGEKTVNFTISPKSIRSAQISPISPTEYNGGPITPEFVVTDGTKSLINGSDYRVTYENNVNAGTARVNIEGIGNYRDTQTTTFVINKVDIARATVVMPNLIYNGAAQTPKPASVVIGQMTLVEGVDYEIAGYGNNTQVGDAKITLQGKGNFNGVKVCDWKIIPQGTPDPGSTETLPATGDNTNFGLIAGIAVSGAALVAVGVILFVRSRNKGDKQ